MDVVEKIVRDWGQGRVGAGGEGARGDGGVPIIPTLLLGEITKWH
jgi:hypothetical protein